MDKPLLPLRFKTSQVAHIAGVEQIRLQGWLDRDNIYLDAIRDRPGKDKHRTYSFLDALRIGLIGRLVAHGMDSAKEASGLVERMIRGSYGTTDTANALRRGDFSAIEGWEIEHAKFIPMAPFRTLTGDARMYVWRTDEGKWDFAKRDSVLFAMSGAHPSEIPDTFVFIHLGNIIIEMVKRVDELGFIPADLPVVTVEDLARDPNYVGFKMAELERAAAGQTIWNVIRFIITSEKE